MHRDDAVHCMKYFWEEKGDLERCVSFDEAIQHFPELEVAWLAYKQAKRIVSIEVEMLP